MYGFTPLSPRRCHTYCHTDKLGRRREGDADGERAASGERCPSRAV